MTLTPYVGMHIHWFNQADRANGGILGVITRLDSDWTAEVSLMGARQPGLTCKQVVHHIDSHHVKRDPMPDFVHRGGAWDFIPEVAAAHDLVDRLQKRVAALEAALSPSPSGDGEKRVFKMREQSDATPDEISKVLALAETYSDPVDIKRKMGPRWSKAAVEGILAQHGKLQPASS